MNVLVVAAHPDDEVIGCGGTIAKHSLRGDPVHISILAEGITSRDRTRTPEKHQSELSALAQSAHQASEILGATSLSLHDFPDNRLDSCDLLDLVKVVEQAIARHRPEIIYTHHAGDLNIDHRCIHQAVVTAARPIPASSLKTILFFEVVSSTEWQIPGSAPAFVPNWFVNISQMLHLKQKALEVYSTEMRPWPHARSISAIEHLARWRGASVGVEAAEAFVVGRHLVE